MTSSQIWVPVGLPLSVEETTATGLRFVNRPYDVVLSYDYFPEFNLRASFETLHDKLERERRYDLLFDDLQERIFRCFVFGRDHGRLCPVSSVRTGQREGFTLYWSHSATDAHIERIATLISGSLWSSEIGKVAHSPLHLRSSPGCPWR